MKKGITPGLFFYSFLFFLMLSFLQQPAFADLLSSDSQNSNITGKRSAEDEEELARLIKVLDKYTEIATKTKLNIDFVPGIVTVLHGEDLEVRGIYNLWEALKLVPGMDIGINNMGLRHVLVRGIGNTISSGNLKFQLNGISMNSALWGKAYPILDMPVEQIDRIEIIRGPGSAVHGEFASTGVVNVITRNNGNRVNGGFSSYNTYSGSALFSISDPDHEIEFSLNVSGLDTNGANIRSGPDQLYGMGMGVISNAPGPTNEVRDMSSGIMAFSFHKFNFTGYYLNSGLGDHFGFINSLAPPDDEIAFRFKDYGIQLTQEVELFSDLQFDITFGLLQHQFKSGIVFQQPPGFAGIYTNGMFAGPFYEESRLDGGFDFTSTRWKNHVVKFGWAFTSTNIDRVWHDTNYIPSTNEPIASMSRFTGMENWLYEDRDRMLNNITVQDEYKINESVTVTAGLRYDHYDDVGSEVSPRIAAVWRIDQKHIIKTQYARAFCPPTFNQLYAKNNPYLVGNPAIDPETIDTFELSYIYHADYTMGRATYFYSDLDNLISSGDGTYSNTGSTNLYGVELELEHQLSNKLKLESSLSYSHSSNSITGDTIPDVAEWMGDLGVIFEATRDIALNVLYGYVGKRNRAVADTRNKLSGYHTVDTTISLYNLFIKGFTLRAGIKNIFNEDIYYASPANTYPEDYLRPGRQWWVKFGYDF